jgi:Beta-lactamase/Domain of unknown function (DUF3471)
MRIETMMLRSPALLGLLMMLGAVEARCAPPPNGLSPAIDAYLEKARKDWSIPGLAVAVVNGGVTIAKGYGAREQGKPERVDENTIFDAASLTKSFTATLAAMMVDEGKMKWDDPIRRYLPDLVLPDPYLTEHATLRDFLSHRTGLERDRKERQELMAGLHPGSRPTHPLESYSGTYESCLFGPIHVRLEKNGLTLQMGEGQQAELAHHHYDTFLVLWRDPLFRSERMTLVRFDIGNGAAGKLSMQIGRDQIEAVAPTPAPQARRIAL